MEKPNLNTLGLIVQIFIQNKIIIINQKQMMQNDDDDDDDDNNYYLAIMCSMPKANISEEKNDMKIYRSMIKIK